MDYSATFRCITFQVDRRIDRFAILSLPQLIERQERE